MLHQQGKWNAAKVMYSMIWPILILDWNCQWPKDCNPCSTKGDPQISCRSQQRNHSDPTKTIEDLTLFRLCLHENSMHIQNLQNAKKRKGLSSKGECRHTFDAEDQLLAKKWWNFSPLWHLTFDIVLLCEEEFAQ